MGNFAGGIFILCGRNLTRSKLNNDQNQNYNDLFVQIVWSSNKNDTGPIDTAKNEVSVGL